MSPLRPIPLGGQTVRQLARQASLRGAWTSDENMLRLAVETWLASGTTGGDGEEPGDTHVTEQEDAPGQGEATGASAHRALPNALHTETMACLLESQGKHREAEALRQEMRQRTPPQGARAASHAGSPSLDPDTPPCHVTLAVTDDSLRLTWQTPEASHAVEKGAWQIELRIWRAHGGRIARKIALDEPRGSTELPRPHDAAFAAAALGHRGPDGSFRPFCRTALWVAEALVSPPHHAVHEGSDPEVPRPSFSQTPP